MKSKRNSLIVIGVTLVVVVLLALLGIFGMNIGNTKYRVMSLGEKIALGLDLRGGIYAVYQGDTSADNFDSQMDATVTIMRNRLTAEGYTEATITRQGDDRIRIEIPDVDDPNQILEIVGTPAHLEFVAPDGTVVLEGKDVLSADAVGNETGTEYKVRLRLNDEGSKGFSEATDTYMHQQISIQLDGNVISAPTVEAVIPAGSDAYITGINDLQEVKNLANLITSGALPLDIEMLEVSAISATLGEDALANSLIAGIIGVALVMLFMIVMYRLPGAMSCLALAAYIVIVFFSVALIPGVQLTLPGIAGILLGVGMAVDANVIIFERFRDELRGGRSVEAAADRGFHNALSAIIDSNITTIIAGIVLIYFGTGSIKGFAITLTIGVVASLITSVVIVRFLMRACTRLGFKNMALYARSLNKKTVPSGKRFTANFKKFATVSVAIVVVAAVMSVCGLGMNFGIDFTGGSLLTYEVGEKFEVQDVSDALKNAGITESQIAKAGADETQLQIRVPDMGEEVEDMRAAFETELRETYANLTYVNIQTVGAVAGADLIRNAVTACLIVFACLLVYIAIRFDVKSGLAALIALLHDVLIMCAFMAFFRWAYPVNSPFVAAMLTIIGYSINNTIIIFDRIREKNKATAKGISRMDVVEDSVRETFTRTVNTTITTLLTLVPVYALGVASIREFTFPILVGMLAGMYSSMLISGQIWGTWMDRDSFAWVRRIFKKEAGSKKA